MTSRAFDLEIMRRHAHVLDFEQEQNKKLRAIWEEMQNDHLKRTKGLLPGTPGSDS